MPSVPLAEKSRAPANAWQTIPIKSGPDGPHPLSGVIRAYTNQAPSPTAKKVKGSGNGFGKGGKGDVGELPVSKRAAQQKRYWELFEQRRAAMREAGKAWQRGNTKNFGGEVAFYFAERVSCIGLFGYTSGMTDCSPRRERSRNRPRRSSLTAHATWS